MILLDTSGLFAALVERERTHRAARRALEREAGALILSPFVLAEVDYLLARRYGLEAELALLEDVARGAYELAPFGADDVGAAREVVDQYRELGIGLADASLVVLANRHGALDLLTLDERHFRAVRGPGGAPFRLLPADAP